MSYIINGIQQIGIGVANVHQVFNWYRKQCNFDVLLFEDEAEATLMSQYTGNEKRRRKALLAMNMLGGGGLEIWQFSNRKPKAQHTSFQWGDLGINAVKLRHQNAEFSQKLVQDPWGNWIQWNHCDYVFCESKKPFGGVMGAVIGVSNMDESLQFYQSILGFDKVLSDETQQFQQFKLVPDGHSSFRRVILRRSCRKLGGFGRLLGPMELELVQAMDRKPNTIFERRFWGDLGFIHLCFDVSGMNELKRTAKQNGYPFTVDSADSFAMGEAAGRFGYIEDPDGTLIELVETHKVPIVKSLGLYIDLKKRNPEKPLPDWMVKLLRFQRKKKDFKIES